MLSVRGWGAALGITCAVWYLICALFVAVVPTAYMWTINSWSHGMNFQSMYAPAKVFDLPTVVAGFVTFTVFGWLSGFLFATVYNKLNTRTEN